MWLEEDERIFVHPRTRTTASTCSTARGTSSSGRWRRRRRVASPCIVFETHLPPRFYLSPTDVRLDLVKATSSTTQCPYKGTANYWTVTAGGVTIEDAVWSYHVARPEVAKIAGMMCFYDEKVVSTVDGERQLGVRK